MLTPDEARALRRIRVLRMASYRCARCGALASAVGVSEDVALCHEHEDARR